MNVRFIFRASIMFLSLSGHSIVVNANETDPKVGQKCFRGEPPESTVEGPKYESILHETVTTTTTSYECDENDRAYISHVHFEDEVFTPSPSKSRYLVRIKDTITIKGAPLFEIYSSEEIALSQTKAGVLIAGKTTFIWNRDSFNTARGTWDYLQSGSVLPEMTLAGARSIYLSLRSKDFEGQLTQATINADAYYFSNSLKKVSAVVRYKANRVTGFSLNGPAQDRAILWTVITDLISRMPDKLKGKNILLNLFMRGLGDRTAMAEKVSVVFQA